MAYDSAPRTTARINAAKDDARVQRGSSIVLEQKNVGGAVWVPQRLEVRLGLIALRQMAHTR
jgi:hypothetical protein